MRIPIQNIYFLLCYAWNKLDEKEREKLQLMTVLNWLAFLQKC